MTTTVEQMGPQLQGRLLTLEQTIERGLHAYRRVGLALKEIREQYLYRVEYDTFQEYCAIRWELSRSYAYRLIDAAEIAEALASPNGDTGPRHESHARALTPLKDDRKALTSVWTALREEHGEEMTADVVHNAVRAALRELEAGRRQTPTGAPTPDSSPQDAPEAALSALTETVPTSDGPAITIHATFSAESALACAEWIGAQGAVPGAVADLQQQLEVQLNTLT